MSQNYLYRRITEKLPTTQGTLAEPDGAPVPRFALMSSVCWMRALALIVADENIDWPLATTKYSTVSKANNLSDRATNTVFEQLLLALQHLSALKVMNDADKPMDLNRIAIMDWYYGIYCAASAMVAAKDGSQQQDHAGTARQWDQHIAAEGLAFDPFGFRISSLIKETADQQIAALSGHSKFKLISLPTNREEAEGACLTYLSGTRKYREWQIKEELLGRELKKLGLKNFMKKEAKSIRDKRLSDKSLGFVTQAFRYRGKANYRDALYLTYEDSVESHSDEFIQDMEIVLQGFLCMAGAYCSKRLGKNNWNVFMSDLASHLNFSVMPDDVWS